MDNSAPKDMRRCRAIDDQFSWLKRQISKTHRDRALSLPEYITAPSEGIDSRMADCQSRPPYRALSSSRCNLWTWLPGRVWRPLQSNRRRRHCGYRAARDGRAPTAGRPGDRTATLSTGWSPAGRRKEWITTLCPVVRPHLNEQFDGERRVAVTTVWNGTLRWPHPSTAASSAVHSPNCAVINMTTTTYTPLYLLHYMYYNSTIYNTRSRKHRLNFCESRVLKYRSMYIRSFSWCRRI